MLGIGEHVLVKSGTDAGQSGVILEIGTANNHPYMCLIDFDNEALPDAWVPEQDVQPAP